MRALRLGVCLGHGRDEPTSAWGARYVAAAGRLVGVVRRRRRAARGAHRGALGAVPVEPLKSTEEPAHGPDGIGSRGVMEAEVMAGQA